MTPTGSNGLTPRRLAGSILAPTVNAFTIVRSHIAPTMRLIVVVDDLPPSASQSHAREAVAG